MLRKCSPCFAPAKAYQLLGAMTPDARQVMANDLRRILEHSRWSKQR